MKLLIHDYPPEEFAPLAERYAGWDVISDDGTIRPCVGCFGCWVKTPGQCVIHDGYETNARRLHEAEEVVVCTKWTYGGFSPFVKNVFDRSIGVVLPFFELVDGETISENNVQDVLSKIKGNYKNIYFTHINTTK